MIRAAISPKPKLSKCKVCRIPFQKRNSMHIACSPCCALKLAKVVREKKAKADYKARKEAVKTRSDYIKEAQTAFNSFIRERDKQAGHNCISSGNALDWSGNGVDAGHYRSVGSAPHLRFDERNVHAQSKRDNRYGAGRAVDYRIGLISRIGLEAVESIEADQEPRKFSIDDLKAIKALYRAKLKALKGEA